MKKRTLILMGILMLFTASRIWAEENNAKYDLGEIIVSATKIGQYQAEIGSSTTVITGKELKEEGKTFVLDALMNVTGISIMQCSIFGGAASIYLRGSKPGHTMVLING